MNIPDPISTAKQSPSDARSGDVNEGLAINTLRERFDALLQSMQTNEARAGLLAAFRASPDELARAAVAAARKKEGCETIL